MRLSSAESYTETCRFHARACVTCAVAHAHFDVTRARGVSARHTHTHCAAGSPHFDLDVGAAIGLRVQRGAASRFAGREAPASFGTACDIQQEWKAFVCAEASSHLVYWHGCITLVHAVRELHLREERGHRKGGALPTAHALSLVIEAQAPPNRRTV